MVITAASENKEAAPRFIDFVLDPANGAWVASNILYKVPSKAAMDAVDPALLTTYPNLAIRRPS
jgi:spermidine/putrescine transport system substrate-binding protein